uniref:Uncharacterized protein n=1 Tax=Solanum tuberosum TaxID=4113 RepID=M1DD49_SOLTU
MSARKSWANEMESENEVRRKPSIWDNFDITKTSNAGFKLNFVSPITQGQIPVCEIDLEDITSEIDYWKNAMVCYVLGAHPPFAVLNGYIRRHVLNPETKDQIDGEKEQSACPRTVPQNSTMLPNDPKHDDAEG